MFLNILCQAINVALFTNKAMKITILELKNLIREAVKAQTELIVLRPEGQKMFAHEKAIVAKQVR